MGRVTVASEAFLREMAALVQACGQDHFYSRLAELPSLLLDCDRWLVMRYSQYARPEFVVNEAMSEQAVAFYLDGIYRLDPLLRISRSGSRAGVYTLSRLREREARNADYDEFFRSALIHDELAILFPAPGRVCIALCLDRDSHRFTAREVRAIEALYPMLGALHELHLERAFAGALTSGLHRSPGAGRQATLILDRDDRPVFRSEGWRTLEREGNAPDLGTIRSELASGTLSLDAGTVLHWEELGAGFALAPRGRLYAIERRSPGYVGTDFKEALARFAQRHALTPQQRNIVELIMRGHPNASIASRLKISQGTVRNHRSRLYFKLDITTERELFSLFLKDLFTSEVAAAVPMQARLSAPT